MNYLYFTTELFEILQRASDPIAKYLISKQHDLDVTVGNFVGLDSEKGHITYLPARYMEYDYYGYAKVVDYDGTAKGRIGGKPARIMKKFVPNPEKFTEQQWDEFGVYISNLKPAAYDIRLVSGEDIRYWYHVDRYGVNFGPLWNSCMKGPNCQHYFDIYVNNPNQVNLLIATQDDKLYGRVLVWTDANGKRLMDRIYADTSISAKFQKWADDNDVALVRDQNNVDIRLDTYEGIDKLPYFDSLRLKGDKLIKYYY